MSIQGRSQVFIGGGANGGNVKFINKTLLQNINSENFFVKFLILKIFQFFKINIIIFPL